mgnify:CR=1 FL=1
MAKGSVNKVILIGNLGSDPEIRYMPNGNPVASFSIATTEAWKDRQSGEKQERTEWHRISIFGRLAEIAKEYLRKGAKIFIEGQLRTRKWQDKNGNDRYTTEIVANEMQMLGGNTGGGARPAAPQQSYEKPAAPAQQPAASTAGEFDDDIPF